MSDWMKSSYGKPTKDVKVQLKLGCWSSYGIKIILQYKAIEKIFQMAELEENSRIVVPFKPTLSHMSLVKLAVQLYYQFGLETLREVHSEIESGCQVESDEHNQEKCSIPRSRVKKNLLLVPTNLRSDLLAAVERLKIEIWQWVGQHLNVDRFDHEKCVFFWRSDGSIDRIKTAQEISRNKNVDITARFEIACRYCLANEVKTLWMEWGANFEANSEIPVITPRAKAVTRFWIRWLREGAQIPWIEFAQECLNPRWFPVSDGSNLSCLFRVLQPEDRSKFFQSLVDCKADDFRFCLYAVTADEQLEIMKLWPIKMLELHMNWLLSSDFLRVAEKAWTSLHGFSFCNVLESLLSKDRTDIDFEYLAEEFWKNSPTQFKEYAKECGSKKIFKFLEKRTKKGKMTTMIG